LHKFKLPMFLNMFFNQDAVEISKDIENKTNLILYNRLAKNVLKYKNPMKIEAANYYKSLINKYISHIGFLNVGISFNDFLLRRNPFVNQIEEFLDNEDITVGQLLVENLENSILMDNAFYRILSLSAFMNPELYSDKYLKSHLEYIFNYYDEKRLVFTNLQNGVPYINIIINDEDLILALQSIKSQENLNIYNIIRKKDDFSVYKCKNIRPRANYNPVEITKNDLFVDNKENEGYDAEMINCIQQNLVLFYSFSTELQNNIKNKNITLANLQKLGNLQQESYLDFLRDIDLQTNTYAL
jgi:hypothetical protein